MRAPVLFPFVAAGIVALGLISGCGGGESGQSSSNGETTKSSPREKEPSEERPRRDPAQDTASAARTETFGGTTIRTDAQGRKWIGDVPLDVWYDDPLSVAAQQVAVVTPEPPSVGATEPVPMPEPESVPMTPSAGDGGTDWSGIIPAAVVEAEVKNIQNQMTARLRVLGEYKKEFKDVQWDGSTLAVMGAVAAKHPEPISWKEKAKYVRHLGSAIEQAAQENDKASFEKVEALNAQFKELLSGGQPADLAADVPEELSFAESADRYGLMQRIKRGYNHLKSNINTADRLTEEKESAIHEAAILAVMGEAILNEGYLSADVEEYREIARRLVEGGRQMRTAAEAGDFASFEAGLDAATKCCTDCHTKYKDG